MKVLKVPANEPWSMEATCYLCSTEVELEVTDFTQTRERYTGRKEETSVFSLWTCPTCKTINNVDHERLPKRILCRLPKLHVNTERGKD